MQAAGRTIEAFVLLYLLDVLVLLEDNNALLQRKKCMVLALANACSRVHLQILQKQSVNFCAKGYSRL